jgi:hypothetical protein
LGIVADQYGSATLRAGDAVTLRFGCEPTLDPTSTLSGLTVNILGSTATITLKPTGPASETVYFDGPSYSFTVNRGTVWPGDANADGRRNMLD